MENLTFSLSDPSDVSDPGPSTEKAPKTEKSKPKKEVQRQTTKKLSVYDMVCEAIGVMEVPKKGASAIAIKKYVQCKSDLEEKKLKSFINKALLKGIENGTITKPKNQEFHGITGSFFLAKKKPKQFKKTVDEKSDDTERRASDSEITMKTSKQIKRNLSDTAIGDFEEKTKKLPKLGNAKIRKIATKEEARAKMMKKENKEEVKANVIKKESEEARGSKKKEGNKEDAKATETKKTNEEAKASEKRKANKEEAKASKKNKANKEEAKGSEKKKANKADAKATETKKSNNEDKASEKKKANKADNKETETIKANIPKKGNTKELKANAKKKARNTKQEVIDERADSSDSEVFVKKKVRKSLKSYSSDTDMDFVQNEGINEESVHLQKTKLETESEKLESLKESKAKMIKLYRTEKHIIKKVKGGKAKSKVEK